MTTLAQIQSLENAVLERFGAGLARRCRWSGMPAGYIREAARLGAIEALNGFEPARGGLLPRAWTKCKEHFRALGFLPRGLDASDALGGIAGGDDPAEILAAAEAVGGLAPLQARRGASARTGRRWAARSRGAAELLAAGGDGRQGELFGWGG
jgi:hypothetical protein